MKFANRTPGKKTKLLRNAMGLAIAMALGLPDAKAATVTWDLTVPGVWDTSTGNWTGGVPTANLYVNGDTAIFNKVDGGIITLTGTIAPLATNVSAASGTYTFTGTGITTGTLTKSGAGTLVLENANTYTGTTTVNGGTLKAGVASVANVSGAFGNNSAIVMGNVAGATLDITGFDTQIGKLTGGGAAGGNVTLGAATLTIGNGSIDLAGNYNGALSGNGTINFHGNHTAAVSTLSSLGLGGTNTGFNGQINITGARIGVTSQANLGGATIDIGTNGQILLNTGTYTNDITVSDGNGWLEGDGGVNFGAIRLHAGATLSGTVTLNSNTIIGVNDGQTGTISGIISGDAGNSLTIYGRTSGILTLSGANTYAGATIISGGTLSVGTGANLGDSASNLIFDGGTLQITGTGLANFSTIGHAVSFNATKAVGLDINNAAHTFTVDQVLNQTSGGFTKLGAGMVILNQANTYTGSTNINGGTLVIGATNTLDTTGAVVMNSGGSGTTPATLDLSNFSQTLGSLAVRNGATTALNADTITIGNGQALTVNGNVTIGRDAAASTTFATLSGDGSFIVGDGTVNRTFQVGGGTGATNTNAVTFDMGGLSTFTANLGSGGVFRIGDTGSSSAVVASTVTLAKTSTITAGTVHIGGDTPHAGVNTLKLGDTENTINANTITLGGLSRGSGEVLFATGTGTLTIRNAAGNGRANLNVVSTSQNTSINLTGVFDTTGHSADLLLGTLGIGNRDRDPNAGGTAAPDAGSTAGTFSFDAGTLDVTTIKMGARSNISSAANVTAELNIGGGTVTIGGFSNLGRNNNNTGTGTATATLNISGGTVSIGSIANMAVNGGSDGVVTSTVNITGGTVTLGGNITKNSNPVTNVNATATLTLDGGTLDMAGHNIGGTGGLALTNVNLRSGILQNLGQLNNGGTLTKTTAGTLILGGINAYTGATAINEGTLLVNGTNTGLGGVTVNADATLGGTGSLASTVLVTSNGILSPGASVESLASGALTMNIGSTFVYEATGNDATGADLMVVNGDLSLTGVTLDLSGADLAAGFWNPGDKLTLISYTGSGITSGFTDFTDDTGYQFGSNTWVINYNDTAPGINYNSEATATGTSFVTLTVTAVPEPTTWVALVLGGAGLCLLRRKQRTNAKQEMPARFIA